MDEEELIKILTILKIQPKQEKGFSFRRTLQTLQQAKKMQAVYDYQEELIRAGVIPDVDPE